MGGANFPKELSGRIPNFCKVVKIPSTRVGEDTFKKYLKIQILCTQIYLYTDRQGCARYIKVGSAIPIQDTGSVSKDTQNVSLV